MKRILYILPLILSSFFGFAEGTKELGDFSANFGGIYLSDEIWYSQFGQYDAGKPYQITISITDPSETIYYGMNVRLPDGTSPAPFPYRILDPAGNVVFTSNTPDVGDIGYIDTYATNLDGPKLLPTDPGYNALVYQPLDSGEYAIEFNPDLATGDPRMILRFFDVTVRDSLDQIKLGRLHSQSWQLSTGCFSCPINTSLFPYHPNGVVYELETNGLIPFVFTVNFNSTGTDTTGVFAEDRKSKVGKFDYPEFEVFLNPPDEEIFPSKESNIEYEASFLNNGCESSLFCLDFTNSSVGVVNGFLDFNNNNLFEPELGDVSFEDIVDSTGSTCIEWDGIDANGNEVGKGEINLVTRFGSGIIHLPLYDIEHNRNGYKISTLKPSILPDPIIFWDDAELTVGSTLGDPLVELEGCQSNAITGCHKWQGRGALTGDRNLQETINTWWFSEIRFDTVVFNYVPNTPVEVSFNPDTLIQNVDPLCVGDSIDIYVFNNGINHYDTSRYTYEWFRETTSGTPIEIDSSFINISPEMETNIILKSIFKLNPVCVSSDTISVEATSLFSTNVIINDENCLENSASASVSFQSDLLNPTIYWNEFPNFNGNSRTDLTAGTYTITVVDSILSVSENCYFDTTFSVEANKLIEIIDISEDSTFCYDTTGMLEVTMANPNIVYEYSWNGSPFNTSNSMLTNLPSGDYNVVVRDSARGCTVDTVTFIKPLFFEIEATTENEFCTDGSGNIVISVPNTNKLTIEWSDIATPDTERNGLTSGTYNFSIFSNLTPGCRIDTSFTISDSIPVFSSLDLSFEKENLVEDLPFICDNDTVNFYILSGGDSHYDQATFTYNWYKSNLGSVFNTNVDAVSVLDSANYSITIEAILNENSNCRYYDTLDISTAPPLEVSLEVIDTICTENRAEASLTIEPSVFNPIVIWNQFAGFNGLSRTDLSSGTYTISVSDENYSQNCRFDTTFTVDANKKIEIDEIEEDNTPCYDSTANIGIEMVENGIDYIFSWNGGAFSSEKNLSDVYAGNYTVIARDPINGCEVDTVITVLPDPIEIEIDVQDVSCSGEPGSITVGLPSEKLVIEWLDITTNDIERTELEAGNYSFQINTGAPDCEVDTTINVEYIDRPVSIRSLDVQDSDCANPTGSAKIEINPFAEDLIYLVSWDNGSTFGGQFERNNLEEGFYEVVIQENGTTCTTDTSFEITAEKTELEIDQKNTICTSNSGSLEIKLTSSKYDILWTDDNTNTELKRDSLPAGTYSYVLVHNSIAECNYTGDITILQTNNNLSANFSIEGYSGVEGAYIDEEVTFINESTPTPTVQWTVEEDIVYNTNNATHIFTEEGEQLVILYIEDEFGCNAEKRQPLAIQRYKECKMVMPNAFSPNCDGINETIGPLGDADEMELKIYNRWGELVFRSIEQSDRWDGNFLGQPAPVAIYVYQLDYSCDDLRGNTTTESETGEITLVR